MKTTPSDESAALKYQQIPQNIKKYLGGGNKKKTRKIKRKSRKENKKKHKSRRLKNKGRNQK